MSVYSLQQNTGATGPIKKRQSLPELLSPIYSRAASSPNLVVNDGPIFETCGELYELPRFFFIGPRGGDVPVRLGIFAAIHGDEGDGAQATVELIKSLDYRPDLAQGFCLSLYPVCNPTGFEDRSARSRLGHDLDQEFWKNSAAPEVRLLQAELVTRSFTGIIRLRTDPLAKGFYGYVRGKLLRQHLIEPAVRAAEAFLPPDPRFSTIKDSEAEDAQETATTGRLSPPPKVRPRPFEITLATPATTPAARNTAALVVALEQIFIQYRRMISYAQNL